MKRILTAAITAALLAGAAGVNASSHREALGVAGTPQSDNTDVYAFRSYEAGREGFVTLIANFIPFQDPEGGPQFYPFDPLAEYAIKIDNNGDAIEDITFAFNFRNTFKNLALNVGGTSVPIPILNSGAIGPGVADTANLDRVESFALSPRPQAPSCVLRVRMATPQRSP